MKIAGCVACIISFFCLMLATVIVYVYIILCAVASVNDMKLCSVTDHV